MRHLVVKKQVNYLNFIFLKPIWCNLVDLRHLAVIKLVKIDFFKKSLKKLLSRCV